MKVAILNYKGVVPTSVSGPYDMLDKVKVIASTFNVAPKTTFDVDIINTVDMIPPKVFNVDEKAMKTGDRYKNYLPGLTVIQPNKVNEYEINIQGKAEVYFFFAAFFPAAFLGAAFFLAGADFFFEAADFFAWSPWSP